MEITQIKGYSETKSALSPNDEFADFETYEHLIIADGVEDSHEKVDERASCVRPALISMGGLTKAWR